MAHRRADAPSPAPDPPRILVIVPAYNEVKTIAEILSGLRRAAQRFDRLVVTDGSTDGTGEVVDTLGERRLDPACNLGYGRALQAGFRYALAKGYDVVVTFDADGQHRPEDVPRLVSALLTGESDVAIGSRFSGHGTYSGQLGRQLGQRVFSRLSSLLIGQRIYDTTSGLRALRAPACRSLAGGTFLDFHTEALVRLALLGFRIVEVPVAMENRRHGQSMHSWVSAVKYPLKTILLTLVAAVDALLLRRRDRSVEEPLRRRRG